MIEPRDRNRTAAGGEQVNDPKDLADQFESTFAPGWRPAIHEVVQGVVIELSERLGYDDKPYPIVVLNKKDGSGEVALHAFHTVLRAKLAANEPAVGDRLAVRYEGKIKAKTQGHPAYHGYSVVVEHNSDENSVEAAKTPADDEIEF